MFRSTTSLIAGLAALVFATELNASEVTWISTGTLGNNNYNLGSKYWNAAPCWSTGTQPGANDLAVFGNALATNGWVRVTDNTTTSVGAILHARTTGTWATYIQTYGYITGPTTLVLNGYDYTLGGETMKLLVGNISTLSPLIIQQNSPNPNNQPFKIVIGNSGAVYVGAGATTKLHATVDDAGKGYSITKKGEGTLLLGGKVGTTAGGFNTYSGGFILEKGRVDTYDSGTVTLEGLTSSPFGTGTLTLRGGSLMSRDSSARTYSNAVALDGTVTLGEAYTATGQITFSNNAGKSTTILRDSELIVQNYTEFVQPITGNYGLKKSGVGVLRLSGTADNSYKGDTAVKEGTLYVSFNLTQSAVKVNNGARLGGEGSISNNVHVDKGGTLAPGMASTVALTGSTSQVLNRRGTLTLGDVALDAGAALEFTLDSTASYDQIYATGGVSLDGAVLNLNFNFQPIIGDTFVLIKNGGFGPIDGLLIYDGKTLADGSLFTVTSGTYSQMFVVDYDYSEEGDEESLAVTAVPEPSTMALLGIAGGAIAMMARRRSRSATK